MIDHVLRKYGHKPKYRKVMPVVLTHSTLRPWLEDASATADILHAIPPELHAAAADGGTQLRLW